MSVPTTTKLEKTYEILSKTYPVFADLDDPWMTNGLSSTPFRALVSACLSTVTTTPRVITAAVPLFERVTSFEELAVIDDEELRELIRSVAHYNRKTQYLKRMSRIIVDEHGGEVPQGRADLMALPGVGRKVTDLILNFKFGELTVGVDTHVHRVLNRLGVVHTKAHTKTADEINELTPEKYKQHAHEWLIQHGMRVCKARTPSCAECPLTRLCDYYQQTAAAS